MNNTILTAVPTRSLTHETKRTSLLAASALFASLSLGACAEQSDQTDAHEQSETELSTSALSFKCLDRWDTTSSATRPNDGSTITDAEFYAWNVSNALPSANGTVIRCQKLPIETTGSYVGYTRYRLLYKTSTIVTNGGQAPNVIPARTVLLYTMRATEAGSLRHLAMLAVIELRFAEKHGNFDTAR